MTNSVLADQDLRRVCQRTHQQVFGKPNLVLPLYAFGDSVNENHFELAPIWVGITWLPVGSHLSQNTVLGISYFVPHFAWLNSARWQSSGVSTSEPLTRVPQEFLWLDDCLELFFAFAHNVPSYIEINVSADCHNGRFNAYQFDDYRTPATLPPPTTHSFSAQSLASPVSLEQTLTNFYTRHIAICAMDHTPASFASNLVQIQPCAILYTHTYEPMSDERHAIFFAAHPNTPPDFHHRAAWINLT